MLETSGLCDSECAKLHGCKGNCAAKVGHCAREFEIEFDHVEEECGVFGVFAPGEDVARMAVFGLQALQHRGQESAGIAVSDGDTIVVHKDLGLVTQVFNEDVMSSMQGEIAVGHVRYSTSGGKSSWISAQPHLSTIDSTLIALAHNGTLVNANAFKPILVDHGVQMRSTTDSEVAAKTIGMITQETKSLRQGIRYMMENLKGAYAMILTTPEAMYAFRDPNGIRPLCFGKLPDNRGWVVSSETCGLDAVGAEYVRDVEPGEIIRINTEGFHAERGVEPGRMAACVFEYVYFARADSVMDRQVVYHARRKMGRVLAQESPVEADLVLGVPDSGIPGAIGYAIESGIPYSDGIMKNRYVGRTFIQPTQEMRQMGVRIKLNPIPSIIKDKRLIVIDDSVVRGNTSRKLVEMLRQAGAKEVHLRIVSPEVKWPCFYGIDTDTQEQLISANLTLEEQCQYIGCDSLAYISLEGLHSAIKVNHPGLCDACFTGDYVVPIPHAMQKRSFFQGEDRAASRAQFGF